MTASHNLAKRASLEYHVKTSIDDELDAPSSGKGDPLAEWASSTLNALGPVTDEPYSADQPITHAQKSEIVTQEVKPLADSAVSTPGSVGHLVPGAFPRTISDSSSQSKASKTSLNPKAAPFAPGRPLGEAVKTGETVAKSSPEVIPNSPSDLATPHDSKEHPEPSLPTPNDGANSPESASTTKRNSTSAPVVPEAETEIMREGTGIAKSEEPIREHAESPKQDSEPTTRPSLGGVESSWDEYRARESGVQSEAGGADTDASTRSLAGTQIDRSLYTPGTSLFGGKNHEDTQSSGVSFGASGQGESVSVSENNSPESVNGDSSMTHGVHHQHPVHHVTPVTAGREHPLASQIEPTPSDIELPTESEPEPANLEASSEAEARPPLEPPTGERIDSSLATPGHGPPPLPKKEKEEEKAARRASAHAAGLGAVAASAAAGAGAGGDVGGAAAGNAGAHVAANSTSHGPGSAPTTPAKDATAHDASPVHANGSHPAGTDAKKVGFFDKLKRAFGGKHHHHKEEEAKKA
ncbi:hypothetical protein BDN70DRAFT_920082 [Pholiota conissans]|uniref:Uncharacterized protein n=1 Tax=Pholiota conissans TaxID=109636 RepID=A0A9P6CUX1_9AGAR|nr:hypothetical protein BDN70DRAFT_920082 [Pholiota conissans]